MHAHRSVFKQVPTSSPRCPYAHGPLGIEQAATHLRRGHMCRSAQAHQKGIRFYREPASFPACRGNLLVNPRPSERQRRQGPLGPCLVQHDRKVLRDGTFAPRGWSARPDRRRSTEVTFGYRPAIPRLERSIYEHDIVGDRRRIGRQSVGLGNLPMARSRTAARIRTSMN
jgi:hypothetical protein